MPRTDSQFPTFTEADLAPSFTTPQKSSCSRQPAEDIIVALEAITSSPTYSAASTTDSVSSLSEFPFSPHDQQTQLAAAHIFRAAGNPAPQLSWSTNQPTDSIPCVNAVSSANDDPVSFIPEPAPPQKQLYSEPSPELVAPHLASWGSGGYNLYCSRASKFIRKSKTRKASPPTPSRFCHICARTQKSTKVHCANLNTERKCRKAVCQPCFEELKWDFEGARRGNGWLCPHCRGICSRVPRARCHIYTKTNEKRKVDRTMKR